MQSYDLKGLQVELEVAGARDYLKASYPLLYGVQHKVRDRSLEFTYNLNGEIKFIQGRGEDWTSPLEWLKRSMGNDWVYYFSGGYANVFDALGEYYLPCFSYPTNTLWNFSPFELSEVNKAIDSWERVPAKLSELCKNLSTEKRLLDFLKRIKLNSRTRLWEKSLKLYSLIKGRVNVLPPDARHADYECIPVTISLGCLYNCGFCCVKSNREFRVLSRQRIEEQIQGLKRIYAEDLSNYASIFLGENDAFNSGPESIEFAALKAYKEFGFADSYIKTKRLFIFASVDSLLQAKEKTFRMLCGLPFQVYINVGLESGDQKTLDLLRKPVQADKVRECFNRILELNKTYKNLEISSNFVLGLDLPEGHWQSIEMLTRQSLEQYYDKGCIYISPLSSIKKKEQLRLFQRLKQKSRLPMYLYLIQRL